MPDVQLLLPDFLLILLGYALCRHTPLGRGVWDGVELLVYYLLFPSLLLESVMHTDLKTAATAHLALAGSGTIACAIALAYALRWLPRVDALAHASGAQCAFRFNSFIVLAAGDRLLGPQGVAWMALLVGINVPICNVAAVWPLARAGGHGYLRELVRNPLIVATTGGLVANLIGVHLPQLADLTLHRMGQAAVPLGLMSVGAGLRFGALKESPGLTAGLLGIRHLVAPAIALGLAALIGLPDNQRLMLLIFSAAPTASSAYVLAARMGGRGDFVAGLVTLSTLAGMFVIPIWMVLAR